MSRILVVIPTKGEFEHFIDEVSRLENIPSQLDIKKIQVVNFPTLNLSVALGGLGKTQFGIQTQYLIDNIKSIEFVICVGASGALTNSLNIGDVVVATETVEHDIKKHSRKMIPRFKSSDVLVKNFRELQPENFSFLIEYGPIASGDEDVMSESRKSELQNFTDAIAVAWEGAGGARACTFNDLPFIEIRGITDFSNQSAESDFYSNLKLAITNVAILVKEFAIRSKKNIRLT